MNDLPISIWQLDPVKQRKSNRVSEFSGDKEAPQWIHFDYKDPQARKWIKSHITMSDNSFQLLTAEDTRPRCLFDDASIFISLRGINLNTSAAPEDMISIRIWLLGNFIITSNNRDSQSIKTVIQLLQSNNNIGCVEDVLINLIAQLSLISDNFIDQLELNIDHEEDNISKARFEEFNPKMSLMRRQVATIRRFLSPQREALEKLYRTKQSSFSESFYDELYLHLDKSILLVENLDLIRERILVLQEQFLGFLSHQQNSRLYLLAIISAIFLPLTFLSGLLGMNVGGLPGLESSKAFWIVSGFCLFVAVSLLVWFKRKHWF